jgi:linoleoyl-CoA desaturase
MATVKFISNQNLFMVRLKEVTAPYFKINGITGTYRLHLKAAIFIVTWFVTYNTLVKSSLTWYIAIPLLILFGVVIAGIGFNIMHDAVHGSFSKKKWFNELMGLWLNVLGGNSKIWERKHNTVHHTLTNIDGYDTDIHIPFLARLHPSQKWHPWMVNQQYYMWFVYSVLGYSSWVWYTDFVTYFKGYVGNTNLNFKIKDHIIFWLSKIAHLTIFILIPWMHHSFGTVILGYFIVTSVVGLVISTVFQLAHVVELTKMIDAPALLPGNKHIVIEQENAVHQILTTANFATDNKILSWYIGGLNFQIEHHLFPKVSHEHYPKISILVKQVCEEFNLPYNEFDTMVAAIGSHAQQLKELGKKPNPQLV